MILIIELLVITILIMIMITLVIDETTIRKRAKHLVRLKRYWDGKERRRVSRHNVTLDVNYSINHAFKNTKTKDISTKGLGLLLEEKFEKKTPISLEIKIENTKEPIKAKARVMWSREAVEDEKYSPKRLFNTGLKFLRFTDPAHEKKLFEYVKTMEKNSHQEDVEGLEI